MAKLIHKSVGKFPYLPCSDKLKIGVFLFSTIQPAWVSEILSTLHDFSIAEVSLAIICKTDSSEIVRAEQKSQKPFLWKVYSRLNKLSRYATRENSREEDLLLQLTPGKILHIKLSGEKETVQFDQQDLRAIAAAGLDVILYFGDGYASAPLLGLARFGIWQYFSLFPQWRNPRTLTSILVDLYQNGEEVLKEDPILSTLPPQTNRAGQELSNLDLMLLIFRGEWQKIRNIYFRLFNKRSYEIAFWFDDPSNFEKLDISPTFRLEPPRDMIYADPFPVKFNGRYYIFFEEMEFSNLNFKLGGHLSVVELDENHQQVGEIRKVLEKKHHLSYPFVFEWNGAFYMIPETMQDNTIELYCCLKFPDQWELKKILLPDIKAVDVTLFLKDGTWWMFACVPHHNQDKPAENSPSHPYELLLFHADTPLGPWMPHPLNPVKCNKRNTRSAGRIFEWNGAMIRPSQDCSPRYGYAVVFNRIDELTPETFLETEITKIVPIRSTNFLGVHTFNRCEGMTVIDIIRFRNRFFS